jgi:hypothetical protein
LRYGRRCRRIEARVIIRDPAIVGIHVAKLQEAGERDDAIAEFQRFYLERRDHEMEAAGEDPRKRKKLDDDFTPRLEMTLVGLEGDVRREVTVNVLYSFSSGGDYESTIAVRPGSETILQKPEPGLCMKTAQLAPKECLAPCAGTGAPVLKHLLVTSEFSDCASLPEFMDRCAFSGKRALDDELETSGVTGKRVASLSRASKTGGPPATDEALEEIAETEELE